MIDDEKKIRSLQATVRGLRDLLRQRNDEIAGLRAERSGLALQLDELRAAVRLAMLDDGPAPARITPETLRGVRLARRNEKDRVEIESLRQSVVSLRESVGQLVREKEELWLECVYVTRQRNDLQIERDRLHNLIAALPGVTQREAIDNAVGIIVALGMACVEASREGVLKLARERNRLRAVAHALVDAVGAA